MSVVSFFLLYLSINLPSICLFFSVCLWGFSSSVCGCLLFVYGFFLFIFVSFLFLCGSFCLIVGSFCLSVISFYLSVIAFCLYVVTFCLSVGSFWLSVGFFFMSVVSFCMSVVSFFSVVFFICLWFLSVCLLYHEIFFSFIYQSILPFHLSETQFTMENVCLIFAWFLKLNSSFCSLPQYVLLRVIKKFNASASTDTSRGVSSMRKKLLAG